MGSFMQSSRGYGSQSGSGLNNFHSVFGGGGRDAGTPPLLDLSEFPSLTNSRGQSDGGSQQTSSALQPPGSKPYGNFWLYVMQKKYFFLEINHWNWGFWRAILSFFFFKLTFIPWCTGNSPEKVNRIIRLPLSTNSLRASEVYWRKSFDCKGSNKHFKGAQ